MVFFFPAGAVIESPINQSGFETYVVPGLLALEQFVAVNLVTFG